jgi:preprotein translocase subunit SecY
MFGSLVQTFTNCFKIPELKSRLLFTVLLLAIARLLAFVHVPGLNTDALAEYFKQNSAASGLLGMYNLFTGDAMRHGAVGALGIMPYISATIIIQLLTAVVPTLSKAAREEGGRAKIIQYGRYLTVILCLIQGTFMALSWENPGTLFQGWDPTVNLVIHKDYLWTYRITTVIFLTTGTMLLMWLGEQITERGIGNGVSLIITIGIVARVPVALDQFKSMFFTVNGVPPTHEKGIALILLALIVFCIAVVIAVTQAQRKIPVQYAQRAVGRKMYAGQSSFLPLKVNYAGVMPVIFASAILMFPQKLFSMIGQRFEIKFFNDVAYHLNYGSFFYLATFGLMILFFSYFWVATQFNEIQIADDLKKNGGYIPGVRPGQATSDYLHNTMSRITLAGAIFLTAIAVLPIIFQDQMKIQPDVASFMGGTSMLITVGVMLDTMRQIESHLMMRHYDGFLKKGKIRGRL